MTYHRFELHLTTRANWATIPLYDLSYITKIRAFASALRGPVRQRPPLMKNLFLEDVTAGMRFETARHAVTRSQILDFARSYDPNRFHLEPEAARSIGLKDVCASGFHTLTLSFHLFFELHLWDEAVLPSPGIEKVRFLRPLYPDDSIFVRATVLEVVPSRSKSDQGVVRTLHETMDAHSQGLVLTAEAMHRLRRRDAINSFASGK
jgi:acyl dehydratase